MTRPQIEYTVATVIMVVFFVLLINSILHARTGVRDDLRRTDLANLKRALEMYNNQHVFYPTPPDNQPGCTYSHDPNSWLFGDTSPLLKEQHIDAIPHDVRESRGHTYAYCVTKIISGATQAYYLEAQLEIDQPDTVDHDHDENRNYGYRILHDGKNILYRVCGGSEEQCTPPS